MKEFIAFDGEGVTVNDTHNYVLLQTSKGEKLVGENLSTDECLSFLIEHAVKYPKAINVIYGGGYDVTKWLRDMPHEQQVELKSSGQTKWFGNKSVFGLPRLYVMEYIPNKWFILHGPDNDGIRREIKIYDVMTFFQSSFIKALESRNIYVDPLIVSGKANRSDFSFADIDEISEYCGLELTYLVELCNTLRNEFVEAGLNVTQWHGPGAVANAALRKYGIKNHHQMLSEDVENAAAGAYYGGRFEHFYAGHYPSKVYVYDINSAYPHFIRELPSMNGEWEYVDEFVPGSYGLWDCAYEPDDAETDYTSPRPLPWRSSNGTMGFPRRVARGWYHTAEAVNATEVYGGWIYTPDTDEKPFAFISDMYLTRKQWKIEKRGGERALKLAMNSLYGKLAQRVGWNEETGMPPKWHQLFWAGYITANTRAMLWSAISQAPGEIIAVETDSVMSRVELDLPCGEQLGEWEQEHVEWLTYIQSGIYFAGRDGDLLTPAKTKIRGLDAGTLHYPEVKEWLKQGATSPLTIPAYRFIALANPQRQHVGNWVHATKALGLAGGKRIHLPDTCQQCSKHRPMSEAMHPLEVPEFMGLTKSSPHKLPWKVPAAERATLQHDEMSTAADAYIDFDKDRRQNALHASGQGLD